MAGHTMVHEHPAVHGMLVVGDANVLLSHLPMFHTPHDFQVLLQVTLEEEGGNPASLYREDRRTSGERVYTWVPKPFLLSSLLTPAASLHVMQGTLFRGHFERGGTPITSNRVHAKVRRVLYSRQFVPSDPRPLHLRYLLFGSAAEAFLAHLVTRPPDYDQIASATVEGLPSNWDGTAMTLEVPDRQDTIDHRLGSGDRIRLSIIDMGNAGTLNVVVRDEFYFETGDLAS